MKKTLVFGTFDLLHQGHRHFLHDAKQLGDYLIVVVARNNSVIAQKTRPPTQTDITRLCNVLSVPDVDEAHLGDRQPQKYQLLRDFTFSTLAIGYDQTPNNEKIADILRSIGKKDVVIRRLKPFEADKYKSSLVRATV